MKIGHGYVPCQRRECRGKLVKRGSSQALHERHHHPPKGYDLRRRK